ncbi:MAG: hypothetical protein CMF22_11370 [Idiomarinaceae bacterium]|nr:hypothetical protein [Idiomarinaceae bacterium]|tara:strand:- start:108074 stop:108598 length:525 start_codon:yes stop_codon:yes gene_type:complete
MNMDKTEKDTLGVVGTVRIEEIDAATGEVVDLYDERNTITAEGFDAILRQVINKDGMADQNHSIKTIYLGNDTGAGSANNPESPSILSTYLDQTVVYEVPEDEIIVTYPTIGEFSLSALLDGEAIVDAAGVEAINYTSATIRLNNDEAFSYKRFPIKTISRLINIRITWNIKFS